MIEAMKQALEALEECRRDPRLKYEHPTFDKAITSLRQAIAELESQKQCTYPKCDYPCMNLPNCQEQKHVKWVDYEPDGVHYTTREKL
jgi:hypothetical protein